MRIRLATAQDCRALLDIYAQYIETSVTFECQLPSEQAFALRMAGIAKDYPYLVCEQNQRIIGYAYAHRHMEREAYQWNAELSVYLDPSFTSKGLGKKLYLTLIEILKRQGIKTVYGCVTTPNTKSEGLHTALGFELLGTYHKAGYKNGAWRDVKWFEKPIAAYDCPPEPIVSIRQLAAEVLEKIMLEQS